ncbi:MAG TPA: hydrogenase [Bacillota bacterium]|nr:hydrogenase [Bacillota bacterium]
MWIQSIATSLLVSTFLLFLTRRITTAVKILSLQSFILTISVGIVWQITGISHFLIAAILTLIIKAVIIPTILYVTIIKIDVKREVEGLINPYTSLIAAIMLSLFAFYLTIHLNLPHSDFGKPYLPVSLSMIFLGAFIMIVHKKALLQGIGLIVMENGLFLIAMSLGFGMPIFIEMGIFFDLLVTVVIIGMFSYRIHSTFESLNTENLQNLKG